MAQLPATVRTLLPVYDDWPSLVLDRFHEENMLPVRFTRLWPATFPPPGLGTIQFGTVSFWPSPNVVVTRSSTVSV